MKAKTAKDAAKQIGKNLANTRYAAGLTQADLAERLGVPTSTVGRWECGIRTPHIVFLPKLATALGISLQLAAKRILGISS